MSKLLQIPAGGASAARPAAGQAGFTLIELLVASLLLGMLVVILTMIFNQSSISWRTGRASIADLDKARKELANYERTADDALPRLRKEDKDSSGAVRYRVASLWKADGTLRERAYMDAKSVSGLSFDKKSACKQSLTVTGADANSLKTYTVGVSSAGPDGVWNTDDDISSWPKGVTK